MSLLLQHPIEDFGHFEPEQKKETSNYRVRVRRKASTYEVVLKEKVFGFLWLTEKRIIFDESCENLVIQRVGEWKYKYNIPEENIDYPKYITFNGKLTRIK